MLLQNTHCIFVGDAWVHSHPQISSPAACLSASALDSDCLLCAKWELLLWTRPLHMKECYWTRGSGVDRASAGLSSAERLVVFTEAFFAFSEGEKHHTGTGKRSCSSSAVDSVPRSLAASAACEGESVQDQRLLA